ncbi:hypothetical protein PCASD_19244 [Puccinia coronata f. sp. avenae]|uniref:Uncharacterized protein n=1 Tax=Puccinia coronata f. sp. avenae TaxID=200324 RepID=A0A2N5UA25_9BASI|nr:hypothetical protein PCASD_19244 [Puccinia coronata f. sp. avenae]
MFNSQGVPHQQGRAADDLTERLYKMQFGTNRCTWDWFIECWDKVKAEAHELL